MRAILFASATVTSRTRRRASTPCTHRPARLACRPGVGTPWSVLTRTMSSSSLRKPLQLLASSDDVAAEWILALRTLAPTPAKAARLRATTVARLLKQHRIRRLDAGTAIGILRQPAVKVAA